MGCFHLGQLWVCSLECLLCTVLGDSALSGASVLGGKEAVDSTCTYCHVTDNCHLECMMSSVLYYWWIMPVRYTVPKWVKHHVNNK